MITTGVLEDLDPMVEMSTRVSVKEANPRLTNVMNLAAEWILGPAARNALLGCLNAI